MDGDTRSVGRREYMHMNKHVAFVNFWIFWRHVFAVCLGMCHVRYTCLGAPAQNITCREMVSTWQGPRVTGQRCKSLSQLVVVTTKHSPNLTDRHKKQPIYLYLRWSETVPSNQHPCDTLRAALLTRCQAGTRAQCRRPRAPLVPPPAHWVRMRPARRMLDTFATRASPPPQSTSRPATGWSCCLRL